jgi:pimeloyl-ACP methyl ester carboxylesterase
VGVFVGVYLVFGVDRGFARGGAPAAAVLLLPVVNDVEGGFLFAVVFRGRAKQICFLDSNPGSKEPTAANEVIRVIQAVRSTTTPTPERTAVVAELVAQGISTGTANWLATNLERGPEGFTWRFNLDAIYELMLDYFRVDLWPTLESRAEVSDFRVVVAERSDRWAPENRARIVDLVARRPVKLDVVPHAGHWLHVDNPAFLIELMARDLY